MIFPAWFFQAVKPNGLRIPVQRTPGLPCDTTNAAGEVIKQHWRLVGGALLMSYEAFDELKRQADAQPDERLITGGP